MKEFIKNLFLYILVGYFVLTILKGFLLPVNALYTTATLIILAIGLLMAQPILSFLTIRANFITIFLMSFIITFGFLYLLKLFMVDFYIDTYTFKGIEFGSVVVNSFTMKPLVTMALGSIFISFLTSLFSVLEKN